VLADALAAAREGVPALVVVSGEAGLGKTRLLHGALDAAAPEAVTSLGCSVAVRYGSVPSNILRKLDVSTRYAAAAVFDRNQPPSAGAV